MPCYLLTYHAYLSWLPDRKRGYVRRHTGILPPDPVMAGHYRRSEKETPVAFTDEIKRAMLDELRAAAHFQRFILYAFASDPSHVHILVGWRDPRLWTSLRASVRTSLTRRLNHEFGSRSWFAEGSSRKRVRNQEHFDHLISTYLPDHPGVFWSFARNAHPHSK